MLMQFDSRLCVKQQMHYEVAAEGEEATASPQPVRIHPMIRDNI